MLYIQFGLDDKSASRIKSYFKHSFDPEWFNDPFVQEMVLDIDKSKIISPYCIQSPVWGQIPPDMLSGGVKALVLMLKTDWKINASKCGDNCSKWILKIAEKKDLTISLEHLMDFGCDFNATITNDNSKVNSLFDYFVKGIKCLKDWENER